MARIIIIGGGPQKRYIDRSGISWDPAQWEELPPGPLPDDATDAIYVYMPGAGLPRPSLWQRILAIRASSWLLSFGMLNFGAAMYQLFYKGDISLVTLGLVLAFGLLILGRVEALHERQA